MQSPIGSPHLTSMKLMPRMFGLQLVMWTYQRDRKENIEKIDFSKTS